MNGSAFSLVSILKPKIERHLITALDHNECGEMLKHIYKQVLSLEELSKITLNTHFDDAIGWKAVQLMHMVDEIEDSKSDIKVIKNIKEEIDSFISNELKMKEKECSDGLYNISLIDDVVQDEAAVVSSEVIGVCDVYQQVKHQLMHSWSKVTSLVGMAGIGKTTLANKLFNDPTVVESFDHRVWIRVGKRYRAKDIPGLMLQEMGIHAGDEDAVREELKTSLKSERYLIVLDDVWDRFTGHFLYPTMWRTDLVGPILIEESESRILITSRLQQLNEMHRGIESMNIIMRLLNREESWDLLCKKVFSQSPCPPQLEKAGMKISDKCEGLPLTILAVARLLDYEDRCNPEYWEEVATKKNHRIFMEAYDEISKVLLPSYTFLPPLLQMCFMFIGLFPPKYEIPRSKLLNLWLADGFFELNVNISSEKRVFECLAELLSNSVVMIYQKSSFNWFYNVKTCGLHSSLWHMSKNLAHETKFALVLSSRNDALGDGIDGHHRVSFINNVLFGIKDVHKSVEDNCASAARSLFCFGPYHQYQVPLCFRLKLLKELDALSIRFYEFPMEVLQLVKLGYLSLTVNGMIPASISQLQLLEFLIVDRHQNIKSLNDVSYLPVEIWSLQKLKHLQVMGSDLPNPRGASMRNLSTLSDVSVHSCTTAVLKGIPGLRNLKIRIELAPADDSKPFICFGAHHISFLCRLYSLKCIIVNPEVVPPVAPFLSFLKGKYLTNLSLSGLGYPWEEMRNIASLPNLEVLKLKNYAFQGPKWEVEESKFHDLKSLVIEDTDLVDWKFGSKAFGDLRSLRIKQCFKLQKIHGKFGYNFQRIELVDCNPCCVEEFKKIKSDDTILDVHSSWDDEKFKH